MAVWYVLNRPYENSPFHSGAAVGWACFVRALMVPATAPWPLRTEEGPRSSSTRSRLKVFCGRMTMLAGPSQMPSRRTVICERVKPRTEKLDGAAGL